MGAFKSDVVKNMKLDSIGDNPETDYALMCIQYDCVVNRYNINKEIHSKKLWELLTNKYNVKSEKNIMVKTDYNIDERNREYKYYKYYISLYDCHVVFFDELRNLNDDFGSYIDDGEKTDKITGLSIYYDASKISTKTLEDGIIEDIKECLHKPSMKNQFFIISSNVMSGYELRSSYVKNIKTDNLDLNYGNGFAELYKKIFDKLINTNYGLYLFHGESGVGKTSIIRRLIADASDKKTIIYVPSYMMENLADPELISFISRFKKAILIIEDSENILSSPSESRSQAVSNILNLSDGLLNDYTELQIIATFNTSQKIIDKALLRAGRLVVNHKFKKLTVKQANTLAEHIGIDKKFDKPTTLAEIYEGSTQLIDSYDSEETSIGFKKK